MLFSHKKIIIKILITILIKIHGWNLQHMLSKKGQS